MSKLMLKISRKALPWLLCLLLVDAAATTGYVAAADGSVYTFDSTASAFAPVTPFTTVIFGFYPSGLASHGSLVYAAMSPDGSTYRFNPKATPLVPPAPFTAGFSSTAFVCRIAFQGSVGYLAPNDMSGLVYSFDATAAPGATPTACTTFIPANFLGINFYESLAYLAAEDGFIYTFDPATSSPTPMAVTTMLGNTANFVAFHGTTGYIASGDSLIYTFNPADPIPIMPMALTNPIPTLPASITFDGSLGYIAGVDGTVYTFDLSESMPTPMPFTLPVPITAFQVLFPSSSLIPTAGLTGNNLNEADYLNEHAPDDILALFTSSTNLPRDLKSAAPTRNAESTFTAQLTQLSFIQIFSRHSNNSNSNRASNLTSHLNPDALLASNTASFEDPDLLPFCKRFSPWLSVFGDYTRQNAQNQTPSFHATSGGAIAAFDYYGSLSLQVAGVGTAYAYTHLNQGQGAGHATIQQGALTAYGTWAGSNWYCDFAAWGGFYKNHNVRNVTVSFVSGTASSHTHGWQFTPHLEIGSVRFLKNTTTVNTNPFVSADWVNCWEAAFRERGLEGLNMGQPKRYCSLLRLEGGLRFQERVDVCWGSIFFREKVSYAYQQSFHTKAISAFLVGSPGLFTVSTFTSPQQLGVAEFEVFFAPYNHRYPIAVSPTKDNSGLAINHNKAFSPSEWISKNVSFV